MSENRPNGLGVMLGLFGFMMAIIAASVIWVTVSSEHGDPLPWNKAELQGVDITVQGTGLCKESAGVKVEEEADRVTLTLRASDADNCKDSAREVTATAVLKQPLAKRKLYDGACLENEWRNKAECEMGASRTAE